jgi:hypothetical protein
MAKPAATTLVGAAAFAREQGRVLTQILVWMISRLPDDERRPFVEGIAEVMTPRLAARDAAAAPPVKRKGRKG